MAEVLAAHCICWCRDNDQPLANPTVLNLQAWDWLVRTSENSAVFIDVRLAGAKSVGI